MVGNMVYPSKPLSQRTLIIIIIPPIYVKWEILNLIVEVVGSKFDDYNRSTGSTSTYIRPKRPLRPQGRWRMEASISCIMVALGAEMIICQR